MKFPIALSLLIIATGTILVWQEHQRIETLRASHAKLVAEAAKSGIHLSSARPGEVVRVTKREREDQGKNVGKATAEFLALAKKMKSMEKYEEVPYAELQNQLMAFRKRIASLDAKQLKELIVAVRAETDPKMQVTKTLIGIAITTFAINDPRAALALLTESPELFDANDIITQSAVPAAFAMWAKHDPMAALDWMRINDEKYPAIATDDVKLGMISGAAIHVPKIAFKLIGELGVKNPDSAIRHIVNAAITPEERTATSVALRDYLASLPEGKVRDEISNTAVQLLADNAINDGFEAGSQWIENAGFTPDQLASIARRGFSSSSISSEDTSKWIDWLGKNTPEGKSSSGIGSIVTSWTRRDYQAAGKWLATASDGPTKNIAISAYAETISEYEPEIAAQWATMLPSGKERERALKTIYENWPQDDTSAKAAAEDFAKHHGLQRSEPTNE